MQALRNCYRELHTREPEPEPEPKSQSQSRLNQFSLVNLLWLFFYCPKGVQNMKTMEAMIAEYLANIAILQARKDLLEQKYSCLHDGQQNFVLKKRIITLGAMIQDSRRAVIAMQCYLEIDRHGV